MTARNPRALCAGDSATIFVRPENMLPGMAAAGNTVTTTVAGSAFEGNFTHLFLRARDDIRLVCVLGQRDSAKLPAPGTTVRLHFAPDDTIALPATA
jgi:spermidine/putrescine transport system ATP-binding protein